MPTLHYADGDAQVVDFDFLNDGGAFNSDSLKETLVARLMNISASSPDSKLDDELAAGMPLAVLQHMQIAPAAKTIDELSEKAKLFQTVFRREGMPMLTGRVGSSMT